MSKKKGDKFEKKVSQNINSGSMWFQKGDISFQDYCIECKTTNKKGFKITQQIIEKLWNESLDASKEPLLIIGIPRNETQIFMLECKITTRRK